MRRTPWCITVVIPFLVAAAVPSSSRGADAEQKPETLWNQRGDIGKAAEAIDAYEALRKEKPEDYEILLRLSRLHYWVGQNLEASNEQEALSHYRKGREDGKRASAVSPERPGGYFFEAANLARENNLKGTFTSLWGVSTVRRLNEKTASIDPDYFYRGPDRFFCAFFTKLPGLLGGSTSKAIEFGKRAVEAFPSYAGNRFFLAEAYIRDGKNGPARRELEAALSLPDDALPDVIPEQRMEKKRAAELLKQIGE